MLRFTAPLYLLLLIPLLAGLIASWPHVHGMAKGRRRFAFALRFLLGTAIVLALAGPEAHRPNEGICTIFLLDRSDSVSQAERRRAEEFVDAALGQVSPRDQAGVIAFGRNAVVESAPAGRRALGPVQSKVDPSDSDLAGAVRLASASFPEGKARRIVLLSDGNETRGELEGAAQVAATDGIDLDIVPLGREERVAEAAITALDAPSEVRADGPFDLRVVVDSTAEALGTIDVDRDGILVAQVPVRLTPGRNAFVVRQTLRDAGFHRYRATLRTDRDRDPRNNIGMGFVSVRGRPRILVLQDDLAKRNLADALRKSGIAVDLRSGVNVPIRAEEYQRYDAVLLNDINAADFTSAQMRILQTAVRDTGIGMGMIGGENSFLPGGWYGTPIAEALPVDLDVRQRKTFPSTSICIVIDTSGSMGAEEDGKVKLDLAKKAAEQTILLMSPLDRVGVAGSTDGIEFVAPMQRLSNKSNVIAQARKLNVGGGGIYIGPSVQRADEVLRKEPSKVRHLLILADGADSTDERDAISRALAMRRDRITTSVVAIGDGSDVPLLQRLAAAGGGRFYLAKKAAQLPAIFTQDAALMSRAAIEEGAFVPKVNFGDEIVRGIADDGLPPLLAYCLTDSRPLAKVAMRTQKDDPLLATWQYGLGTTLAFTSDAQARWAQRWVEWSGFSTFWAQSARAISRRATLQNYEVALRKEGGKGVVDIVATDRLGNPIAATDAEVRVATPSGGFREISLSQEAPGRYRGTFDANELGTYIATVAEKDGAGGNRTQATAFSVSYPPEYATFRANESLLRRAAESTGGKALTKPAEAMRPALRPGVSIQELWPFLIAFAALLLPLDIATRRLALPMREILSKAMLRLRHQKEPARATEVVERLQRVKRRTPAETSAPAAPVVLEREDRPAPSPAAPATGNTAKDLLAKKRERRN
jgi:uncharacterized membrane protein